MEKTSHQFTPRKDFGGWGLPSAPVCGAPPPTCEAPLPAGERGGNQWLSEPKTKRIIHTGMGFAAGIQGGSLFNPFVRYC